MQEQTLGRRIQEARKAAGLSQESLGERLGVSRQAVSKWESDASVPDLENLIAMSRIFGVTIGALLGVEPPEAPSEGDAPESPGDGAEDAAPVGELTDRELAAVEAIAQKYLEAVQRPRWSRRKKLAAVAGACAAGLLIVLILNGIFSSLGRRLDQVQDQVNYVQSSVSSQIGSLTGQLSGLLEEQNSLISGYDIRVADYSLEETVLFLSVSVTPKEYTADTVVTFSAWSDTGETSTSSPAQNNGGVFTVENWAVPMASTAWTDEGVPLDSGGVQISVAFEDGGTIRTQTLETLYDDLAAYRLDVDGFWNKDWENGAISFGSLDLKIDNATGIPVELTDAELALFYNGEAEPVWSAPLDAAVNLWEEQGYVQMFSPAGPEDPVPVENGQSLVAAIHITDDHGQDFWYLLGGWRNSGGDLYSDSSGSLNGQYADWRPGDPLQIWE